MERMSDSEIEAAMEKAPEWAHLGDTIQRTFQFADFATSMKFVRAVAELAEKDQHHPDMLIRYNKVTLTLSTHDAGGISQRDFELAAKCDAMLARAGAKKKA